MVSFDIDDVKIGEEQADYLFLGDTLIWPVSFQADTLEPTIDITSLYGQYYDINGSIVHVAGEYAWVNGEYVWIPYEQVDPEDTYNGPTDGVVYSVGNDPIPQWYPVGYFSNPDGGTSQVIPGGGSVQRITLDEGLDAVFEIYIGDVVENATMSFDLIDGTATEGVDYNLKYFTYSIDNGVTWLYQETPTIPIAAHIIIRTDTAYDSNINEQDETFMLEVSVFQNSQTYKAMGIATIINNPNIAPVLLHSFQLDDSMIDSVTNIDGIVNGVEKYLDTNLSRGLDNKIDEWSFMFGDNFSLHNGLIGLTIAMQFKPTSFITNTSYFGNDFISCNIVDQNLIFKVTTSAGDPVTATIPLTSILLDNWNTIIFSVTLNKEIFIMINGEVESYFNVILGDSLVFDEEFYIGKSNLDSANCVIDYIDMYNRGLSVSEAEALITKDPVNFNENYILDDNQSTIVLPYIINYSNLNMFSNRIKLPLTSYTITHEEGKTNIDILNTVNEGDWVQALYKDKEVYSFKYIDTNSFLVITILNIFAVRINGILIRDGYTTEIVGDNTNITFSIDLNENDWIEVEVLNNKIEYIATENQTDFVLDSNDFKYLNVYVNGLSIHPNKYSIETDASNALVRFNNLMAELDWIYFEYK